MVELRSICKAYKPSLFKSKVQAVKDLSLSVNEGDVFGLVGPNGAGKSTTIRMMLGLLRPDSGQISYYGDRSVSSVLGDIGYLPENPYLYDHLSLLELLAFCGRASDLSHSQIENRGNQLMSDLGLFPARFRPLRTFSKGMLQRAGICFALLHNPSLVIFDEPMSGLDPIGRKMVFDLIMGLKSEGKTIFFCSHILNDVERLCNRIGLLNRGRLVREFTSDEFYSDTNQMVFIKTNSLNSDQIDQIAKRGGNVRNDLNGHLIAIQSDMYFNLNHYLEESGAVVNGCKSEWMSLEDMFIDAIQEELNA